MTLNQNPVLERNLRLDALISKFEIMLQENEEFMAEVMASKEEE